MNIKKEIYSFDVKIKTEEEESSKDYRIIIKAPNRSESEEADLQYSIEISNLLKKGVLTRAMLLKKYDELTGGDQHRLKRHMEQIREKSREYHLASYDLGELLVRNKDKKRVAKKDKDTIEELKLKVSDLKQEIVLLEAEYSQLFEFTADSKAAQKQILWYVAHLCYYSEDDTQEWQPLVPGENWEEKRDYLYEIEDSEESINPLIEQSIGKCLAFISLWYHSVNPSLQDFEELDNDINNGKY
tara:strand:+ start:3793 stop:4521 length:729 start_codon:yes stop_codon:yes gene_type:complete